MKTAITIIALCALATWASAQNSTETRPAWLPSTAGLQIASHHTTSGAGGEGDRGWNNRNGGAFIGWKIGKTKPFSLALNHELIVGGFKNSLYQQSYYVALDTTTQPMQTPIGSFALALSAGAISGYDRMTAEYTGQPVPSGQRIKERCNAQSGCRKVLRCRQGRQSRHAQDSSHCLQSARGWKSRCVEPI